MLVDNNFRNVNSRFQNLGISVEKLGASDFGKQGASVDVTKSQMAKDKRIEELELELAMAKERLKIGSQLIENLVHDTKSSLKYFIQSFDLVTQSNFKRGTTLMRTKTTTGKIKQMISTAAQNIHKKTPKLITKKNKEKSLKEVNEMATEKHRRQSKKGDSKLIQEESLPSGRSAQHLQPVFKTESLMLKQDGDQGIDRSITRNFVHPAHHNFNMVFNIMLGIKMAVDAQIDLPMFTPTDKDYKIRCELQVAPYKTENSDLVKACSFFDYAPKIFASIRKHSGISKEQYLESLGPEKILGYIFKSNF